VHGHSACAGEPPRRGPFTPALASDSAIRVGFGATRPNHTRTRPGLEKNPSVSTRDLPSSTSRVETPRKVTPRSPVASGRRNRRSYFLTSGRIASRTNSTVPLTACEGARLLEEDVRVSTPLLCLLDRPEVVGGRRCRAAAVSERWPDRSCHEVVLSHEHPKPCRLRSRSPSTRLVSDRRVIAKYGCPSRASASPPRVTRARKTSNRSTGSASTAPSVCGPGPSPNARRRSNAPPFGAQVQLDAAEHRSASHNPPDRHSNGFCSSHGCGSGPLSVSLTPS
jgi:hypothetical protein